MSHRIAPEAEADLNKIWYFVAVQSGSLAIADLPVRARTIVPTR